MSLIIHRKERQFLIRVEEVKFFQNKFFYKTLHAFWDYFLPYS